MSEFVGLRFTAETSPLNLRLQGLKLALHGRRRATAGQPELLRLILPLQPLLQS